MNLREQMIRDRKVVVEECLVFLGQDGIEHGPCKRIDGAKCSAYMNPKAKWSFQRCPLATHCVDESHDVKNKVRIGQQKGSKH